MTDLLAVAPGTDFKVHAFLLLETSGAANKLLAEGLPFDPNIRIKLFTGMDVASSSRRKPTVAQPPFPGSFRFRADLTGWTEVSKRIAKRRAVTHDLLDKPIYDTADRPELLRKVLASRGKERLSCCQLLRCTAE